MVLQNPSRQKYDKMRVLRDLINLFTAVKLYGNFVRSLSRFAQNVIKKWYDSYKTFSTKSIPEYQLRMNALFQTYDLMKYVSDVENILRMQTKSIFLQYDMT